MFFFIGVVTTFKGKEENEKGYERKRDRENQRQKKEEEKRTTGSILFLVICVVSAAGVEGVGTAHQQLVRGRLGQHSEHS